MSVPRRGGRPPDGEGRARVRIADPDGLHARPCARISEMALASGCVVEIVHAGRSASAISIFEMLGLGVAGGDEVEIRACGPDAAGVALRIAGCLGAR